MRWDETCSAMRRDGKPCEAPAIHSGFACRRHGGSARQVAFAAERRRRQITLMDAIEAWHEAEGTDRAFDRLCPVGEAQRSLEAYEDKLAELARARAKLRRLRAAQKRAAGDRQERAGIDGRTQEPCGSTECSAAGGAAESAGLVEQLTQPAERFVRPGAESGPRAGGHSGPRGPDYASRDARARPDSASPGKRPDASHRILCLC